MIEWIEQATISSDSLEHKKLESYRGYLIYIARTYPMITLYLKGIHLTLDSWRPWRKEDRWMMSEKEIRHALLEKGMLDDAQFGSGGKASCFVERVSRLRDDIHALKDLFEPEQPPRRSVCLISAAEVIYSFGDASGSGFSSSFAIKGNLHYSSGQWHPSMAKESLNYRELANLVLALENVQEKGPLIIKNYLKLRAYKASSCT